MFQAKVVEKIKTHILHSIMFFENRNVYGVIWKNTVDPCRPQMTICLLRIACWVTEATNTHSAYVALIVFSNATIVARTRFSVPFLSCLFQYQWMCRLSVTSYNVPVMSHNILFRITNLHYEVCSSVNFI